MEMILLLVLEVRKDTFQRKNKNLHNPQKKLANKSADNLIPLFICFNLFVCVRVSPWPISLNLFCNLRNLRNLRIALSLELTYLRKSVFHEDPSSFFPKVCPYLTKGWFIL